MPAHAESIQASKCGVTLFTPQGMRRRHEDAMRSTDPDVSIGATEMRCRVPSISANNRGLALVLQ